MPTASKFYNRCASVSIKQTKCDSNCSELSQNELNRRATEFANENNTIIYTILGIKTTKKPIYNFF